MSSKQDHINKINESYAAASALKIDDFIEEEKKRNSSKKQKEIDAYNEGMNSKISGTEDYYNRQINNAKIQYEKSYERNAVQKLINEKQIAEKNANLGLTDSGLNKTQQTAVQMAYANQKSNIDISRQKTLDEFSIKLADAVTSLKNEKQSGIYQIENKWDAYSEEQAKNAYNSKLQHYENLINSENEWLSKIQQAEIDAQRDIVKQQINQGQAYRNNEYGIGENQSASGNSYRKGFTGTNGYILPEENAYLSRDYYGTLKENNIDTIYNYDKIGKIISVTYIDNNSKKTTTIPYGTNPYTGNDNTKGNGDAARAATKYGTYDNGYQPRGVYKGNVDYGKIEKAVDKTDKNSTFGIAFNVFKTTSGGSHYWIWDASINNYVEVQSSKDDKGNKVWKLKE